MCCHPALTPSSAIALTLRAVGGLTTAEIANAFLVPEATMAQRIGRAKQSIKASRRAVSTCRTRGTSGAAECGAACALPDLQRGLHSSSGPELHRRDLANEAIRLDPGGSSTPPRRWRGRGSARAHAPDGCAAAARTGPEGELIPLDKQDRTYGTSKRSPRASH